MNSYSPSTRTLPHIWNRLLLLFGLFALCSTLVVQPAAVAIAARTGPQLLQAAAEQPNSMVTVLVQKLATNRAVEDRVAQLGGTLLADLPIIDGFSARMRADAAAALARDPLVRWVTLDRAVVKHACTGAGCIDPSKLYNAYPQSISADQVWNRATPIRGKGIGVAVLDSGINLQQDLYDDVTWQPRVVASVAYNAGWNQDTGDMYGHGNQIAGIIAGNGNRSGGAFVGIAPNANLINVKISDDLNQGTASTASMVTGMQWIYDNRATYNIRVVNISLTDSVIESYNVSILCAAAEKLWFNGIVVVVAAGNGGKNSLAAPGNDPFVITVGASDDKGTSSPTDDTMPTWSSYGTTVDSIAKPDIVAPGVALTAAMPIQNTYLAQTYPANVTEYTQGNWYFTMTGTSVAAPVVSGAVALLLQAQPNLTPDQVKYRLKATARPFATAAQVGAGELNIQSAIDNTSTATANTGIAISQLNNDGSMSSTWNSSTSTAKWSTAKWSTAKWSTAKWSTAKWSTSGPVQVKPRKKTK